MPQVSRSQIDEKKDVNVAIEKLHTLCIKFLLRIILKKELISLNLGSYGNTSFLFKIS